MPRPYVNGWQVWFLISFSNGKKIREKRKEIENVFLECSRETSCRTRILAISLFVQPPLKIKKSAHTLDILSLVLKNEGSRIEIQWSHSISSC